MAAPEKDLKKLEAEEAEDSKDSEDILASLDKEAKTFDKDSEIARILAAFRANAYDVLDLQPGVPPEDIKKTYRKKSLLIHPDKSSNPRAPDAFDRLALAYQTLLDEPKRARLDEAIGDARFLIIRELGFTNDSEEVKDPDTVFMAKWREKVKWVLADNEARRQRQLRAQMQEEGREARREEAEMGERKRKREAEVEWERTREGRIGSWRAFAGKGGKTGAGAEEAKIGGAEGGGGKKKVKKMKTLG
ncbi:DnaJ sub C member 8 [Teratosphaeriaceae sp. CCFEE 6253]|nr:DnaJ sub C member 8 [Teratosphaeriaceae sp. CCFEE 6253]